MKCRGSTLIADLERCRDMSARTRKALDEGDDRSELSRAAGQCSARSPSQRLVHGPLSPAADFFGSCVVLLRTPLTISLHELINTLHSMIDRPASSHITHSGFKDLVNLVASTPSRLASNSKHFALPPSEVSPIRRRRQQKGAVVGGSAGWGAIRGGCGETEHRSGRAAQQGETGLQL